MYGFLKWKVRPITLNTCLPLLEAPDHFHLSIVDMAVVGQYQGPDGTAALAVVAPIWNIIYSLGLLMGIGGSVIYSISKGRTDRLSKNGNEYFTAAVIGSVFLAIIAWIAILFFDKELLLFFGAKEHLLELAQTYLIPIKFCRSMLFIRSNAGCLFKE